MDNHPDCFRHSVSMVKDTRSHFLVGTQCPSGFSLEGGDSTKHLSALSKSRNKQNSIQNTNISIRVSLSRVIL
eukprot:UN20402